MYEDRKMNFGKEGGKLDDSMSVEEDDELSSSAASFFSNNSSTSEFDDEISNLVLTNISSGQREAVEIRRKCLR